MVLIFKAPLVCQQLITGTRVKNGWEVRCCKLLGSVLQVEPNQASIRLRQFAVLLSGMIGFQNLHTSLNQTTTRWCGWGVKSHFSSNLVQVPRDNLAKAWMGEREDLIFIFFVFASNCESPFRLNKPMLVVKS